jgi:multidrug efflux pump subunit AcrA (membrane-fusion protein)
LTGITWDPTSGTPFRIGPPATASVVGLRDRALIGLMVYSFARIGAVLGNGDDRLSVLLGEPGGDPGGEIVIDFAVGGAEIPFVAAVAVENSRGERRLLGAGVLVLFISALALGVWRHYQQHRQVSDTAEHQASFVPNVRVEKVAQRLGRLHVTLPATTLGFVEANIYARASGYVVKRHVDIGDHVKAGQLLAEITAPEVDAQVAQFQNSLQQSQATIRQNEAQRASTELTSRRISILANDGWATKEQGDTDWYAFQAQTHATMAAQYNTAATEQQLKYYNQQKIYQQVVAPFDGVIT